MKLYRSDGQNGICGVYTYLTRLQVAKFALAGSIYYRRNKIISYQVVRIEQFNKGSLGKIGGETERTSKHHRNEDIDSERTLPNLYLKKSDGGLTSQWKKTMKDLNATFREKKDSTAFEGMIITSDTEFFERLGWKKGADGKVLRNEKGSPVQKIRENKRRPTDMGEMSPLSGMLYCADCGKKMYLCRCTTMKQAEYFNCSTYRKQKKRFCGSHQITVKAVTAIIQDDLKRTIHFAKNHNEEFLQTLRKDAEAKTKKELKENLREIETSEERIDKLDKIIESLYEDKVAGKISEERYLKMSDTYEAEQATLKERVKTLKAEIEKAKEQDDKILDFMLLIYKYSNFEELTPEILRSFIDKVIVHEKTKVNGHYRQTVEIIYNFVGAIVPSCFNDDDDS